MEPNRTIDIASPDTAIIASTRKKEEPRAYLDISIDQNTDFIEPLLGDRSVYIVEKWENITNIPSRIIRKANDEITCECLIDKERSVFESRIFPRSLFSHLKKVEVNLLVMISIKSKAGSIRVDIFDGTNLVEKEYFELLSAWNSIDGSIFTEKLDTPLNL